MIYLTHFLHIRQIISTNKINDFFVIPLIGCIVGFLSGLLGKGGSAITTPALQIFAGVNPFAALASPLPAALPSTLSASLAYRGKELINNKVVIISILSGIPATIAGSFFTGLIKGNVLMLLTALFVFGLGSSFFLVSTPVKVELNPVIPRWKVISVACGVGFLSGLLANSGGVLFGPLFIRFLKIPTKQALASSLLVSAGLAIPGTLVHWYLGHIDWQIVLVLSISSIPFSYLGAKTAIHINTHLLERIFGFVLIFFGVMDFIFTIYHMK